MNETEIFHGIQYIALFMGWTPDEVRIYLTIKYPQTKSLGKLAFNESWDLLMPVIDKIESMPANDGEKFQFNITGDGISITRYDDGSGVISQRAYDSSKKLQYAFEVVIEFIKWHKSGAWETTPCAMDLSRAALRGLVEGVDCG